MNDTERPTPETDAALEWAAAQGFTVESLKAVCDAGREHFQRMERERDEAREQRDTLRRAIGIIMLLFGRYGSEEEIQTEIDRLAQP